MADDHLSGGAAKALSTSRRLQIRHAGVLSGGGFLSPIVWLLFIGSRACLTYALTPWKVCAESCLVEATDALNRTDAVVVWRDLEFSHDLLAGIHRIRRCEKRNATLLAHSFTGRLVNDLVAYNRSINSV
jgi:hypothetical protein